MQNSFKEFVFARAQDYFRLRQARVYKSTRLSFMVASSWIIAWLVPACSSGVTRSFLCSNSKRVAWLFNLVFGVVSNFVYRDFSIDVHRDEPLLYWIIGLTRVALTGGNIL
jgi:hypothetical protein